MHGNYYNRFGVTMRYIPNETYRKLKGLIHYVVIETMYTCRCMLSLPLNSLFTHAGHHSNTTCSQLLKIQNVQVTLTLYSAYLQLTVSCVQTPG